MRMSEKISIIMPAYNCEDYIANCIESILHQAYDKFELLIIDDGSTDSTGELCEKYKKKDERIKVFHTNNKGVSHARNIGLDYASGQYLTFVDADDKVMKNGYIELIDIIKREKTDAVVGRWLQDSGSKQEIVTYKKYGKKTSGQIVESILFYNWADGGGYPWNKLIDRKKILDSGKKLPRFREELKYYEDKCWFIELLMKIESVYVSDVICYHYYCRPGSLSHNLENPMIRFEMMDTFWEIIQDITDDSDLKDIATRLRDENVINKIWNMNKRGDGKWRHEFRNIDSIKLIRGKYSVKTKIKCIILKLLK